MIHSAVVPGNSVDSLRYILQHKVKVDLIFLSSRVKAMLHLNYIRMVK